MGEGMWGDGGGGGGEGVERGNSSLCHVHIRHAIRAIVERGE